MNKRAFIFTLIITILVFAYVCLLTQRRFFNFEFGKFDLGNMAQIVWNTGHGRFMEVTDQFGTNMPRWGMSHVDPILLVFVPFYMLIPSPLLLVFLQQFVILSAVIPIYLYLKKHTRSDVIAMLVSFTYIIYPAIGYTLVWTGFHGISFVAPLLIWIFWLLDSNDYFNTKIEFYKICIYWVLIILMLLGKEEIGSMLAIASVFLYLRNKKLAVKTFVVSIIYFIFAFFVLIPSYSDLRNKSVDAFVRETEARNVYPEKAKGGNFFLDRYSYLGDTYPEMILGLITHPNVVLDKAFNESNLKELNYLLGPFGYLVLVSPLWLISLPDVAIGLLSSEEIFSINNHRIAFIVSTLFMSYMFGLSYLSNNKKINLNKILLILLTSLLLLSTVYCSKVSSNPLYLSAESLVKGKIINKILAADESPVIVDQTGVGDVSESDIPRNSRVCLDAIYGLINEYNPNIYTGPDYLGAHASNRYVNALFPSRISDADMVVADVFDAKIYYAIGKEDWDPNVHALNVMVEQNRLKEIFACDQLSVWIPGNNDQEIKHIDNPSDILKLYPDTKVLKADEDKYIYNVYLIDIPTVLDRTSNSSRLIYGLEAIDGGYGRASVYWVLRDKKDDNIVYQFIDYIPTSFDEGLDSLSKGNAYIESRNFWIPKWINTGEYDLYFGVGNLLSSVEIMVKTVSVK